MNQEREYFVHIYTSHRFSFRYSKRVKVPNLKALFIYRTCEVEKISCILETITLRHKRFNEMGTII